MPFDTLTPPGQEHPLRALPLPHRLPPPAVAVLREADVRAVVPRVRFVPGEVQCVASGFSVGVGRHGMSSECV
jgi:hypothetical protein